MQASSIKIFGYNNDTDYVHPNPAEGTTINDMAHNEYDQMPVVSGQFRYSANIQLQPVHVNCGGMHWQIANECYPSS